MGQRALYAALIAILAAALLYPLWLTIRGGLAEDVVAGRGWTLQHIALVFRDPSLRRGLINAALVAIGTIAVCLLIGTPLAALSVRFRYPLKGMWNAAMLVPLVLPPFVGALGLKAMLGRYGAINTLLDAQWDILGEARIWGVIAALSLHLYPIVFLNARAAMANIDPSMEQAARIFGAGPLRRFMRVTLPLIRPGLFAGGTIVFVWAFTELGAPLIFDFRTIAAVQIYDGVREMQASARPYALTAVTLALVVAMYLTGKLAFGREPAPASARGGSGAGTIRLSGFWALAVNAAFASVALVALLPHIGVVLMSLAEPGSWYRSVVPSEWTLSNFTKGLGHPLAFGSIINSLMLASAAVAIDAVLGLAAAHLIVRGRIRGRWLLDALVMIPLAAPGLVVAFGYVAASLRWPFGPGDPLDGLVDVVGASPNPFPLLALAYAVRRLPYVVRSAVAGLQQVPEELEEAASIFGASRFRTLRTIVTPLIAANLLAGGLLAFAFAMLEVSDSLILAQRAEHYPITKAILGFTERLGDGVGIASAMGVWAMALLATTFAGASLLLGKRLGAVFRA